MYVHVHDATLFECERLGEFSGIVDDDELALSSCHAVYNGLDLSAQASSLRPAHGYGRATPCPSAGCLTRGRLDKGSFLTPYTNALAQRHE